ncbi:hypothetical protein [Neosynechococcus sphagnicola]|uniref:hypothetical protein n=1 Tax=Neosynechococcus sphagnicola TaxID=1501145 RepID=UPI00068F4AFA|nr:hypothetical protein [Neosynechococcus sphagnicola]
MTHVSRQLTQLILWLELASTANLVALGAAVGQPPVTTATVVGLFTLKPDDDVWPVRSASYSAFVGNSLLDVLIDNSREATEFSQLPPLPTQPAIPRPLTAPTPPDVPFLFPPTLVQDERVNPLITTFILNNFPISHLTRWELGSAYSFANDLQKNPDFNVIVRTRGSIQQNLSRDNVFSSEQWGEYVHLQTVRTFHQVTVTNKDPQTIQGLLIQQSFTGDCSALGIVPPNPNYQCTLTPALVVDRNSIDPQFQVPTRISQPGRLGDLVSPESLAILAQPGFQNIVANGQVVGLDLFFPNIGGIPGNSDTNLSTVTRLEEIYNTPALGYYRVRQILRSNHEEAVLGRTIRGTNWILNDPYVLENTAAQLATEFLPDANPKLAGSDRPANTNVSRNLFQAANNTRIPDDSITSYHAGIGYAKSPQPSVPIPAAHFNSLWVGLSAVTDYDLSNSVLGFELTSPLVPTVSAGAEGGVNQNVAFVSAVNNQVFSTQNLADFYVQLYLTFFQQNAFLVSVSQLTETTHYFPHISFTGNITDTNQILRYYTGVIASNNIETVKAYLGADTTFTWEGWTLSAGAIGYVHPDRDYYSRLSAGLSKQLRLNAFSNITLFSGMYYALDQPQNIGIFEVDSLVNFVNAGMRLNVFNGSLGATYTAGNLLPNSISNTLRFDVVIPLGDYLALSGYYSPLNDNASRSLYGAELRMKLGNGYNSPSLVANWSNVDYNYGDDPFGVPLRTQDNLFTILFRIGEPAAPFRPRSVLQ